MTSIERREIAVSEETTYSFNVVGRNKILDFDRKKLDCRSGHSMKKVEMRDRLRRKLKLKSGCKEDGDETPDPLR